MVFLSSNLNLGALRLATHTSKMRPQSLPTDSTYFEGIVKHWFPICQRANEPEKFEVVLQNVEEKAGEVDRDGIEQPKNSNLK